MLVAFIGFGEIDSPAAQASVTKDMWHRPVTLDSASYDIMHVAIKSKFKTLL